MTLADTAPDIPHPAFPSADTADGPRMQRARGQAFAVVGASWRGGVARSGIRRLHQAGCAKLRFPRLAHGGCEAVLINTSGGLTGGDEMRLGFAVEPGAALTVTTQACERIYRSSGGTATVDLSLRLGACARLAYLPQETILFDGGRLSRRLDLEAAADSRFLLAESVILGREAMGETVGEGAFADQWRLRRDGRLVLAENLRLAGPIGSIGAQGATLGGARAFSTLVWQGLDPAGMLAAVRRGLGPSEGASLIDGLVVVQLVAPDGYTLRKRLLPLVALLAQAPVPLVWSL